MSQLVVKVFVIALYVIPVMWAALLAGNLCVRVWRSEYVTLGWLNPFTISERYVEDELKGKALVADAIYQDDMIVGRLRGEPTIDTATGAILFPKLVRTDALEPERAFVFRQWDVTLVPPNPTVSVIRSGGTMVVGGDAVSLPASDGRVLEDAHAMIVRKSP